VSDGPWTDNPELNAPGSQQYQRPPFPVWLLLGGRVNLFIDVAPEMLADTLRANTANPIFHAFSSKPLMGRVSGDGHIVVARNTHFVNNGWQSFLDARIAPYNSGSPVDGRFRLSWYVMAFSIVWLGFALIFTLTDVVSGIGSASLEGLVTAALFPGIFIGIVLVARLFALDGELKVMREIQRLANPHPPDGRS
jgi:hypothetical protein